MDVASYGLVPGALLAAGESGALLSSINVVLETLRQDRALRVSPATFVGNRSNVRQTIPEGLDRLKVESAANALHQQKNDRLAAIAERARVSV